MAEKLREEARKAKEVSIFFLKIIRNHIAKVKNVAKWTESEYCIVTDLIADLQLTPTTPLDPTATSGLFTWSLRVTTLPPTVAYRTTSHAKDAPCVLLARQYTPVASNWSCALS